MGAALVSELCFDIKPAADGELAASYQYRLLLTVQHLFTTDRTPSTLQDPKSFESDWQVIRKYSSL